MCAELTRRRGRARSAWSSSATRDIDEVLLNFGGVFRRQLSIEGLPDHFAFTRRQRQEIAVIHGTLEKVLHARSTGAADSLTAPFVFPVHFFAGIRHLVWDAGYGFDQPWYNRSAWAVVIATIVATLLLWIVGLAVW